VNLVDSNSSINTRYYDGYELSFNARLPKGANLFGGWSSDRIRNISCDTNDPNKLLYCDQTQLAIPFRQDFKMAGHYPLPWGLAVSGTFMSFAGNANQTDQTQSLAVNWPVPAALFPGGQTVAGLTLPLVPPGSTILTHCNAGALATAGYGTALGVIRAAHFAGRHVQVFADETRPFLQGARLTTWELQRDSIPVTLITDNMAGYFMHAGKIDLVIVGADRIAANGDAANKIGTYSLAVLAKEHHLPFYVAAPLSTIDRATLTGADIPIEQRPGDEVRLVGSQRIASPDVEVANPAFDVTPARYIRGIITEVGVAMPPNEETIAALFAGR